MFIIIAVLDVFGFKKNNNRNTTTTKYGRCVRDVLLYQSWLFVRTHLFGSSLY